MIIDLTVPHRTLLLGVYYSCGQSQYTPDERFGQSYRDRIRCRALAALGHDVRSADDKHTEAFVVGPNGREQPVALADRPGLHVHGNFADTRRFFQSLAEVSQFDAAFDYIILDYFFSPAGWAASRWTDNFFEETIPAFAESNRIVAGGQVWLPYLDCVRAAVEQKFAGVIGKHYAVRLVSKNDVMENPLYAATSRVREQLLECPEAYTNETQLKPLLAFSDTPFLVLTRRPPPRPLPQVIVISDSSDESGDEDGDDDSCVVFL
jgi:hypothetical protein